MPLSVGKVGCVSWKRELRKMWTHFFSLIHCIPLSFCPLSLSSYLRLACFKHLLYKILCAAQLVSSNFCLKLWSPDEWPQEPTKSCLSHQKSDHASNGAFNSISSTSAEHPFIHTVSMVHITRFSIAACPAQQKPCTQYKVKGGDMVTIAFGGCWIIGYNPQTSYVCLDTVVGA